MESVGTVVKVSGKSAFVQIKRTSACGSDCSKCVGCGTTGTTLKLENMINAREGDQVNVVSQRNNLTAIVFHVYIIPLIVFIVSYLLIFSRLTDAGITINHELAALAGAFIMMMACYFGVKLLTKKFSRSSTFDLKMQKYQKQ